MGLNGVMLLLAGVVICAPLGTAAGTHSLRYNLKMRSQDHFVNSRFFAEGHLDDQLFLHYDSERGRAEARALWAETVLGAETWDSETQDLAGSGKNLRMTLADINTLQEQKGGSHFLQESWGCEMQEDNRTRGFWDFYYDEEPFLSFHPEIQSWSVHSSSAQTLAMKVKKYWKSDDSQSKIFWAHVQGTVCGRLRRYLNSWITFNETIVSPIVTVTCSEALEDTINVTCVAFGFYPQNISLTWLQNGEPLSQETQQSVGVLPYGNGTYQTWVSTRIPQGQELSFSCRARHTGKDSTVTVPCGELWHPSRASQPGVALPLHSRNRAFLSTVAIGAVILALLCVLWRKKRETTSAAKSSGLRSSQVLDHQQMVTRNHKGTKQLGSTFQGDAVGSIRPEDLEPLCDEAELEGHNSR
ncbi:MHC class I polypeptide-related sequence B-like isoform X1 [Sciurus carolinensis]|uniref:MHC class I polypeptide-related sequence B-like isoform X1 n=2 Tax=Sciurus carolinensis TaxID=30640 RepID=UPI001FB51FD0|nr:MHC class I polypeptide-related sequence B-like isoform X1 [Sciurus carolinensis]